MLDIRAASLVPMTCFAGILLVQQLSIAKQTDMIKEVMQHRYALRPPASDKTQPASVAAIPAPAVKLAALEPPPERKPVLIEPPKPLVEPDGPHMEDSILADYAYSEVEPDEKPAKIVLASLDGIPEGTPIEEIDHASKAFGLDPHYMEAVAKIESDFQPKERTGRYIGLFQLSDYEFSKYGAGKITDSRDNAIAAAYKFATEAKLFEIENHKAATPTDLYLMHQQGEEGAAQHLAHPDQLAWKNMCNTGEGREKGESWCKRAIWENTLPSVKKNVGSVDKLLSQDFVQMWEARVHHFLTAFSDHQVVPVATAEESKREHTKKAEQSNKKIAHYHHHLKA